MFFIPIILYQTLIFSRQLCRTMRYLRQCFYLQPDTNCLKRKLSLSKCEHNIPNHHLNDPNHTEISKISPGKTLHTSKTGIHSTYYFQMSSKCWLINLNKQS